MGLAVEKRDPDVGHRIPGGHSLGHLCAHALLDAGDVLPRHHATDDLVDELEPGTLRQRFDLDVAHAVLTVTAGLFHVASVALGGTCEGLAQRHLQRLLVDCDPVVVRQAVEDEVQVRLTQAPEHLLTGVFLDLQDQARVLGQQPGQRLGKLVLVGLRAGDDGRGQQRLGHLPGLEKQGVRHIRQRVAGLRPGELGHRDDVSRNGGWDLLLVLAQRGEDVADALVDVVVGVGGAGREVPGDVDRGFGCERPGEHPDKGQLADVGLGGGLHDLRQQRSVGVTRGVRLDGPIWGRDRDSVVLRGAREALRDQFQDLQNPEATDRVDRQQWVELAAHDSLFHVLDDRVDAEVLAADPGLEQCLVLALGHDRLDQLPTGAFDRCELPGVGGTLLAGSGRVVGHLLRQQAGEPGDRVTIGVIGRKVERKHTLPKGVAQLLDGVLEAGALVVEFGQNDGTRGADLRALVPDHPGAGAEVLSGRDDEQGGVGGPQPGP